MNSSASRGRLAPSPTGGLHVGHARTFLIAWILARKSGGAVVLRIEDLDVTRVRAEAAASMLEDLEWLGLGWDEGPDCGGPYRPYVQSERMELFYAALERLKAHEQVYPCVCTRAEIARAASAPHAEDEGPVYPGTCSKRSVADAESLQDRPFAWRFRVPSGPVEWNDLVLGRQSIDPSIGGGDFIVARQMHGPAYQLAVVHDDATMAISQVIRGDDLLASTPRQLLLYEALGWKPPSFGHVPLVLDTAGKRLAKRDGSVKLATLREDGINPGRLIALLGRSIGLDPGSESATADTLISAFDLDRLPRQPWIFDPGELRR